VPTPGSRGAPWLTKIVPKDLVRGEREARWAGASGISAASGAPYSPRSRPEAAVALPSWQDARFSRVDEVESTDHWTVICDSSWFDCTKQSNWRVLARMLTSRTARFSSLSLRTSCTMLRSVEAVAQARAGKKSTGASHVLPLTCQPIRSSAPPEFLLDCRTSHGSACNVALPAFLSRGHRRAM
jgi:hypothetical protein